MPWRFERLPSTRNEESVRADRRSLVSQPIFGIVRANVRRLDFDHADNDTAGNVRAI
jgi:hypothetical protein